MSFPAYPEHRDSGVDWLGEVPTGWVVTALKRSIPFQTGGTPPTGNDDFYGGDETWITIGDMDGRLASLSKTLLTQAGVEAASIPVTPCGSLLFSFKLSIGQVAFAERDLYTNEAIASFLPADNFDLKYGYYALPYFVVQNATENIYGAKLLNRSRIENALICVPSLPEQRAIAAFLDRETARIDAAVVAQERLIALLAEKRGATIAHAVTKGLDPNAPMKDSGIEWLGQIPAHWVAKRLRFLCKIETGDGDTQDALDEGDYPFFVRSPNIERITRFSFDCEAVMTSGDGAGVGKIYHHYAGKFTAHQRVYVFHGFSEALPRLVYYYFQAFFARVALQGTAKSTVESLRRPMLADFWVPVPERNAQQAILEYCEETDRRYAAAIEKGESAIVLLKERCAALISAAVTGKIDVRGEMAADTQEAA